MLKQNIYYPHMSLPIFTCRSNCNEFTFEVLSNRQTLVTELQNLTSYNLMTLFGQSRQSGIQFMISDWHKQGKNWGLAWHYGMKYGKSNEMFFIINMSHMCDLKCPC